MQFPAVSPYGSRRSAVLAARRSDWLPGSLAAEEARRVHTNQVGAVDARHHLGAVHR